MHRRRGRGCELLPDGYEQNGHGYDDRGYDRYRDCKLQNADAHELNDRGHDYGRDRDHDYDDRDCGHGNQLVDLLTC